MTIALRQSTASQEVLLGPFVDSTDGVTAETGLTIANTDIKIHKAGATTLASKNSGGATHISNGNYYAVLDATDTDTVGSGAIVVQVSGALAFRLNFHVYEEAVYDMLYGASAVGYISNAPVNVAQFGGSNLTAASGIPEVKVASIAANAITATAINADAITAAKVADGAIDRATFAADTGLQTIRSNTAQSGASGSVTLDASASSTTDFYKGSWILITGGTGAGQARLCTAYNGTSKAATIAPNWATNPNNTSTFAVIPAAGVDLELIANAAVSTSTAQLGVNVVNFGGSAGTFASGRPEVNTTHAAGTAWGSGAITAASIATDAITNAKIAADAIGAAEIADGAIDAATFAAGAITASAIATDAIGAAELAADAASEIGTAVWATAARTLTAATNITSTGGTTVPQTGDSYARLGAPAGASVSADVAAVKTDTGNILTKLLKYVQLIVRKDSAIATDNATELTAINANGGSGAGSFDNTTDSEQAIRDNMTTPPTAAAIADQVWEEALTDHSGTSGSTAEALNAAGSAGDPWNTALPGAYASGKAGYILGTNLDATVSSRASQTSVDTIDDFVDTEVAAIKAKTDNLPSDPADASDIAASFSTVNSKLDAIDDYVDTEIAAIKAKTDNLPSDPADASDIAASFSTVNSTLSTIAGYIDTEVAAIKAKTDNLPASPAATGDAMTLTSGERNSIADALLKRDWTSVTGEASRSVLNALRSLRNRVGISGGTVTVYKEDDTTSAWTAAATTDANADPITEVDPS